MTQMAWSQVRSVVEPALDLPVSERARYLDRTCPDPELRRCVDAMLASFDRVGSDFLSVPAVALASLAWNGESVWIGRRIGAYQILDEIAEGGMGAVYRAVRVDQQYEKQVAIKVIRGGSGSGVMLARFRAERQILANLDHPNIARLLDGGSEQNSPYFVMELVDGVPIDRFCRDRALSVEQRLILFRTVCSAVQHAHQALIVHRDLKPGNILVTRDGIPKLLDFGIAKILDPVSFPGAPEPTAPMLRMLTLEYASPEQVRCEPITTGSDVYSLGVVLYVLLTGQLPYPRTETAHEMATAICNLEPAKPSAAGPKKQRGLSDDLDTVVLKALQKDPQRRYGSVAQFSDDLRRCLEGLAVSARPDTFSYRTSKFVRRNKKGICAAALIVLLLMAGLLITVREARTAEVQRARAERRFSDVRKLANSLIFELHDSIQNLPGSTPARKLLVDRAVEYLDSLATEMGNDSTLQRELAQAYRRLGMIQGDQFGANLGDPRGGLATARKASAIWDVVALANPDNVEDQLNMAYGHRLVGNMSANVGGDAAAHLARAIAISEKLQRTQPGYARVKRELSRDYASLASLLDARGQLRAALGYREKVYAIQKALLNDKPGDRDALHSVAVVETEICDILARFGEWPDALRFNREALLKYEILAGDQTDAVIRREMAFVLGKQGEIQLMRGDLAGALAMFRENLRMIEPLATTDPQNALLQGDKAFGYMRIGRVLTRLGRVEEGLQSLERGSEIDSRLNAGNKSSSDLRFAMAFGHVLMGEALARKGDLAGALRNYGEAQTIFASQAFDPAGNQATLDRAAVLALEGSILGRLGRIEPARAAYEQAISLARPFASDEGDPQASFTLADAYSGLGNLSMLEAEDRKAPVSERISRLKRTQAYYSDSLHTWTHIGHFAALSPNGFECGNAREAALSLDACNARLRSLRTNQPASAKNF